MQKNKQLISIMIRRSTKKKRKITRRLLFVFNFILSRYGRGRCGGGGGGNRR